MAIPDSMHGMNAVQHTHMTAELARWKGQFPDLWHRTMRESRDAHMHHRKMRDAILERDVWRVASASPTHTRQMAELEAFQKAMAAPLPTPKQWFRMPPGGLDKFLDTKRPEARSQVIFKAEADRNALLLLLPPTP